MRQVSLPIYEPARQIESTDLLCMVLGSKSVEYKGFGCDPNLLTPWQQQSVAFVSPSATNTELLRTFNESSDKTRQLWMISAFGIALCILFSAMTIIFNNSREIPAAPLEWRVSAIHENDVEIIVDNSKINILTGSRMPNGDMLLSTSVAGNSYTTGSGTTRLGKIL